FRRGEHGALQGRELLGPPVVVGGVEAEVHDLGVGGDPRGERGVGGVAGNELGTGGRAAPGAVHGNDVVAKGEELFDEEAADVAGAEDDVPGHDALTVVRVRMSGRTAVRAVTTSAPLAPKMMNCWSPAMPAGEATDATAAQPP